MGCIPDNIEIIPFLQKEDLNNEYKRCALMLLPTRQESWGLVVNEAASFGTPIVSTYGSGAAVEFLSDKYTKYLAEPNDVDSLYSCVRQCLADNSTEYSKYLKAFSRNYSIERSVSLHAQLINRFSK
jgi:glycosyltransferase involved in cell wall biosynthesis